MKTRGREWTQEARDKQRQVALRSKLWEKSSGAKSDWGKMVSMWNGYKAIPFEGNEGGKHDCAITAARGMLEALRMQLQRRSPIKQDIEDFKLAVLIIYRFATENRDIAPYAQLFQHISSNITESETPPVKSSECEDIEIAMRTMREVLKQCCRVS